MNHSPIQQMAELLILKMTVGLNSEEEQELDRLKHENDVSNSELQIEIERIELAVAAADLACFQNDTDTMPEHLKDCVLVDAGKYFQSQTSTTDTSSVDDSTMVTPRSYAKDSGINPWTIATIVSTAACILILLNTMGSDAGKVTPSLAQKLDVFLNSKISDMVQVDLLPGPDATGEGIANSKLYWSTNRQEGYMRFSGLAVNDPKVEQYQLWIFEDAGQQHPIDGGVFDIKSKDDLISIDPKILAKGKYFAVTVEKPGGVVVSSRKRIASVGSGLAAILAAAEE